MSGPIVPLFGPIPGGPELLVILLIAVLLFGANKIPKLARSTGQAMGEFQRGREEIEQELEEIQDPAASGSEDTLGETDDTLGDTDDTLGSSDTTSSDSDLDTERSTDESSSS